MLQVLRNSDCSDLRVKPSVYFMTCVPARTESALNISCEILCGVPESVGEWRNRVSSKQVAAPYCKELRDIEI